MSQGDGHMWKIVHVRCEKCGHTTEARTRIPDFRTAPPVVGSARLPASGSPGVVSRAQAATEGTS